MTFAGALCNGRLIASFPQVSKINTGELAALLADPSAKKPILIDVRTKAEFEVSHLLGARRVEPESKVVDANVPAEKKHADGYLLRGRLSLRGIRRKPAPRRIHKRP
jgi:rhodanese-related sulfurtransferase